MQQFKRIFLAGHRGMVGSAILRQLSKQVTEGAILTRSRTELDLQDAGAVSSFLHQYRPDLVIFAAARVGGIHANRTYPVQFLTENLNSQLATINGAFKAGVTRLLFLGSTCIYPRMATQPITEDQLLTGSLESTNEAYALAKICGLKLCQYYRQQYGVTYHSAMPTNLYGPGDNYHPDNSHVLPALLRRFHEAKTERLPAVTIWGSGTPRREFLHVDDLADALLHLLELDLPPDWVNVGSGRDLSILELARLIAQVVDYPGEILLDPTKPDGTPRKLTDTSLLTSLGWQPKIGLAEGIRATYQAYLRELANDTLRLA